MFFLLRDHTLPLSVSFYIVAADDDDDDDDLLIHDKNSELSRKLYLLM